MKDLKKDRRKEISYIGIIERDTERRKHGKKKERHRVKLHIIFIRKRNFGSNMSFDGRNYGYLTLSGGIMGT